MESTEITLLAVDDNPADLELLRRTLAEIPEPRVTMREERDLEALLPRLDREQFDVVVLDYQLGLETGLELLHRLKENHPGQAVIMLTGAGNEQVAVEAMKGGALDYLVKNRLTTADLRRSLQNVLDKKRLQEVIAEQEKRLARLAMTDQLTGLYNRHHLMERFSQEVQRSRRYGTPLSIILMDLDDFKKVNDTRGHLAGDRVLLTVADLIRCQARATDVPTRFGGDEFCILAVETDLAGARILGERLRRAVADHRFSQPALADLQLTCSVGVAELDGSSRVLEELFNSADQALYRAKEAGRNRCHAAPS